VYLNQQDENQLKFGIIKKKHEIYKIVCQQMPENDQTKTMHISCEKAKNKNLVNAFRND